MRSIPQRVIDRAHTPLVSSSQAISLINRSLTAASHGRGAAVMIWGDVGVGKTRLLVEAAVRAHEHGFTVLFAEGGLEGVHAFSHVARALHTYSHDFSELRTPDPMLEHLERALSALMMPPNGTPALDHEEQLTDVVHLLERLTRDGPVFLGLDQIHTADEQTLATVRRLMEGVSRMSIVLVGAIAWPHEQDQSRAVMALRGMATAHHIDLHPLSIEDTTALVTVVLGAEASQEVAATVYALSQGYPYYIHEALRALRGREHIDNVGGIWELTDRPAVYGQAYLRRNVTETTR